MEPSLVIMAAGIGSRYGGIKQLDRFGPSRETLLDYSIYDAIKTGFNKVVFVIRKEIEKDFKEKVVDNLPDIDIQYVYQELDSFLPDSVAVPKERNKPWGTGHAIMLCQNKIAEPFGVINADDFYGRTSYSLLYNKLKSFPVDENNYAMIGFKLINTLSEYGGVARGICEVDNNKMLKSIKETFKIEKTESDKVRYPSERGDWITIDGNKIASMNMFGFTPAIFKYLNHSFPSFLEENKNNPKSEFLIPDIVENLITSRQADMEVLISSEKWFGVTYKQDKQAVIKKLQQLVNSGVYPTPLWK
jgi:UTP-glucose-1-phosphate uridylyltransferase